MSNTTIDEEAASALIQTLTIGEHVILTGTLGVSLDKADDVDPIAMLRALGLIAAGRLAADGEVYGPDTIDALSLDQLTELIAAGSRVPPRTPPTLAALLARVTEIGGHRDAAEPFRAEAS